jgi:hypothetical protein
MADHALVQRFAANDDADSDASFQALTGGPGDSGGGPPHNAAMEARIKALETILPTLATKEDLVKLRGETREGFADVRREVAEIRGDMRTGFAEMRGDTKEQVIGIQRWMIATVVGLFLGFGGLFLALSNGLKQTPAPSPQQPVIINNMPAAPAK